MIRLKAASTYLAILCTSMLMLGEAEAQQARQAETKPVLAKPAEANAVVAKPVATKPVETNAVVAKPVAAKPAKTSVVVSTVGTKLVVKPSRTPPVPVCDYSEAEALSKQSRAELDLEIAYEDLRVKTNVNTAAGAALVDRGDAESVQRITQAASELNMAQAKVQSARENLAAAQDSADCIQREKSWRWSFGVPARIAGGAAGSALWSAGLRVAVASTPRSHHQLQLDYLQLTNFDFDEPSYRRTGHALSFASLAYAYGFERVRTGIGIGVRLSPERWEPNKRLWLMGRAAVEFGARSARYCKPNCVIGTGSLLIEPWIPLDGETPLTVIAGVELQLGGGFGPMRQR
jgi:hypothetical protein